MLDILYSKHWAATDDLVKVKMARCQVLTKGIQKTSPCLSLEGRDLSTGTAHIRVKVERFPQVVKGLGLRSRTDVQQDADVGLISAQSS